MRKTNKKNNRKLANRVLREEDRQLTARVMRELPDQLHTAFTFRFVTGPSSVFNGAFSVTPGMLLDAWFIAGTATIGYQLFDFVRVKRVSVRAMGVARPAVTGVSNASAPMSTVGIEFIGLNAGQFSGGKQKSDSALGYEAPAFVSLSPDPKSQTAQFQPTSGNSIFNVRAIDEEARGLEGAVIEVDVVLRNSGAINPAIIANARAGMTPGNLYFGGLDGNPTATTAARSTFIPRA